MTVVLSVRCKRLRFSESIPMVHGTTSQQRGQYLGHLVSSPLQRPACLHKLGRTLYSSNPLVSAMNSRTVFASSRMKWMTISAGRLSASVSASQPAIAYNLLTKTPAKFQYTFFDAFGQNNNIPEMPITPFPTLFTAPVYRPANNSVELTVSNFFYEDPKTRTSTPLDVYLGNLGPLTHRVYQATPPGPLTNVSPFVQTLTGPMEGGSSGDPSSQSTLNPGPPRYMPSGPLHTIVIVDMPPLQDVIKALEEDAIPPSNDANGSPHDGQHNGSGAPPPSITGRSLPLLFIRASDGVGYHSGRTIACENVFHSLDLGGIPGTTSNPEWLAAAQAAAAADGGLHGWTLRVM